jgi:Mn2+/Fe2+ NRAMP family transporter
MDRKYILDFLSYFVVLAAAAPFALLIITFTVLSLAIQIFSTYEKYAKYLKYLALILVSYIISGLMLKLDWRNVLQLAITPTIQMSKEQIILICAVLGTTISPYLFFWQTSQEVEESILGGKPLHKMKHEVSKREIRRMRVDVWSGMFVSNLVMFFIIMTCAATLYTHGITNITTAADAAIALRPFAGNYAFFLFTIGVIGTGMLAIPVLAGASSYAISESFGWKFGLYRKLKRASAFYGILIISMGLGLIMNLLGMDPIKTLIYSALLNGLIAPVILVLIVLMSSNPKIMGEHVNSEKATFFGWLITFLMIAAGAATLFSLL